MSANAPRPGLSALLDLTGQTVVVTGAGKGIGQATACRFAESGAFVVLLDRDDESATAVVDEITTAGGSAEARHLDVTDDDAVRDTFSEVLADHGDIGVLVNNAGAFPHRPFLESDDEIWSETLDVNLLSAVRCTRAAAAPMVAAGQGSVVNVASVDAYNPGGDLAHYDAAKAGVVMFTKSLAWELRRTGVRVNAVVPGAIKTPGMAVYIEQASSSADPSGFEARSALYRHRMLLGHRGDPDEVALAILFLASPMASFVHGAMLHVDGGILAS